MTAEPQPASEHRVSWERDTFQMPDESGLFVETHPTGYTTVWCTCGLRTDPIPDAEARALIETHSPTPTA